MLLVLAVTVTACAPEEQASMPADTSVVGAYRIDQARTGKASGHIGDSPEIAYRIGGNEPVIASPVIGGSSAFVADDAGDLVAFHPRSGEVGWRSEIGDAEASVVVSADSVFSVTSDGLVRRHEIGSGTTVWENQLDGSARSSPILFRGDLIAVVGRTVAFLDPTTGTQRRAVELDGPTDSSPAVSAGALVIGTGSNRVAYIDVESLDVRYLDLPTIDESLETYADGVAATPAVFASAVFVGSTGGLLVSTTIGGTTRWMIDLGSPIYGAVAVGADLGYVPTAAGDLVAFDLETGRTRWSAQLGDAAYASPVLVGDVVLATAENGQLFAFDAESGEERWAIQVGVPGNYMASTPAVLDSFVVVGSNDGSIVGVSTGG